MAIGSKKVKRTARDRRKFRIRKALASNVDRLRLSVFRSSKFTYAQIISDVEGKTLLSACTKDADVIAEGVAVAKNAEASEEAANKASSTKSVATAFALGKVLAKKALDKQLSSVVFDRNGFLYHGRIKAVAEGAREGGLKF
jgi:large subunit ribosomal protein L18